MAANSDGVLVSGADNGTMHFWDWKTGYNFQRLQGKFLNIYMISRKKIIQRLHSGPEN